jgi:hypothetical protein
MIEEQTSRSKVIIDFIPNAYVRIKHVTERTPPPLRAETRIISQQSMTAIEHKHNALLHTSINSTRMMQLTWFQTTR